MLGTCEARSRHHSVTSPLSPSETRGDPVTDRTRPERRVSLELRLDDLRPLLQRTLGDLRGCGPVG